MLLHRRLITIIATLFAAAACSAAGADMRSRISLQPPIPPGPATDGADWMQFNNGEWLKGEITDLQDDDFVFESDELDELSLDWSDVYALYSSRINTVVLQDRTTVQGRLRIEGNEVTVITDEGEQSFARDEVRSILPGELTWRNLWSGKITLGLSLRRGNVDQSDLTISARAQRRDAKSRLTLNYDGVVSDVDGTETANNHRGVANYDVYLTERLYLTPFRLEAFRDRFSNIDYRLTPSVGLGYTLIDDSDLEWSVGGGFGWQFTKFNEVEPGESRNEDTASVLLNTTVDWEATPKVDVLFRYDITVPVPDTNEFNFRADLRVEIDIYKDLDLDIGFLWDRINEPAADEAGEIPDQDDFSIFVGLGWEF